MKINQISLLNFFMVLTELSIINLYSEVEAFANINAIKTTLTTFLKHRAEHIIENSRVNTQCTKDLKIAIRDFMFMKRWALEMIDSSSKPSGILSGNYFAFGNFEQCLNIHETKQDTVIMGQYCSVLVTPSKRYSSDISFIFDSIALANYSGIKTTRQAANILKQFKMTYGLCLPDSCSIENLQKIWDYIENTFMIPVHVTFKDFLCRSRHKEIEPFKFDQYIVALFAIYFGLILFSTLYDVASENSGGERNNILISFSLYSNFKKIFSYSNTVGYSNDLKSINGIKVLSILWIIFGHRMIVNCFSGNINSAYISEWRQNLSTTFISAAHLAVDTFFALSGLLISYGFLKFKSSVGFPRRINFLLFYFYRFLRLGPALLAIVLFYLSIYKNIGDGPIWSLVAKKTAISCYNTWWLTLLFVSNFVDIKYQCLEQSWYLAIDSQLFFISPVLLTYLSRNPRKTCLFCILICTLSGLYAFIITLQNNYGATYLEGDKEYFHYIYFATFVRIPPWLIGFIFGYLITKYQNLRIPQIITLISWIVLILLLAILIGIHIIFGDDYNSVVSAIYNSTVRQIWALTICSMVFLCTTGNGGIINDFLSLPSFQILVKLTYSVYLVHLAVIVYFSGSKKHPEHFSNLKGVRDFMGDLLFIFIVGTIWCLAFESPFISIGKILINKVIDATSKFPYNGIATATRFDFGNFDQCVSIDHSYSGGRILGKHCFPGMIIPDLQNLSNTEHPFKLSSCQPEACSAADLNVILRKVDMLVNSTIPIMFFDTYCTTKETHKAFAAEDYITLTIIGICIALMIMCTTYDLYLENYNKRSSHPLFLAFSVYSNGKKLLQTSIPSARSDQILIFHGMKIMSMMWIVAGHGISLFLQANLLNQQYYMDWRGKFYPLYLSTAVIAVETFFYISGFLMAYQYLKLKSKPLAFHIMGIPTNIIHRYLRLTPAMLMAFLVTISIHSRLATGPMQPPIADYLQKPCKKYWWSFFLYIQNYYNHDDNDLCIIPTWYLSADMQMFLISPFILIPLALALKNPKNLNPCMICMFILNTLALAIPIAIKLIYKDYKNLYDTHSRLITYFIGITMGVYLRETKDKPFLSHSLSKKNIWRINLIVWIFVLLSMLGICLWFKEVELHGSYEYDSVLYMITRLIWATGLSWMVYSSYYGYGGFINWLLTLPIMQIGGKLSYCIYLLHPLVVFNYAMQWQTKMYFSDSTAFQLWCGYFIMSIIIAFFWTLAFESPLIIVEKFIFGGIGTGKSKTRGTIRPTAPPLPKIDIEIVDKKDLNENEAA